MAPKNSTYPVPINTSRPMAVCAADRAPYSWHTRVGGPSPSAVPSAGRPSPGQSLPSRRSSTPVGWSAPPPPDARDGHHERAILKLGRRGHLRRLRARTSRGPRARRSGRRRTSHRGASSREISASEEPGGRGEGAGDGRAERGPGVSGRVAKEAPKAAVAMFDPIVRARAERRRKSSAPGGSGSTGAPGSRARP